MEVLLGLGRGLEHVMSGRFFGRKGESAGLGLWTVRDLIIQISKEVVMRLTLVIKKRQKKVTQIL